MKKLASLFILTAILTSLIFISRREHDTPIRIGMSLQEVEKIISNNDTYLQIPPNPLLRDIIGTRDISQLIPSYISCDDRSKYFPIRIENPNTRIICEIAFACNIMGDINNNKVVFICVYNRDAFTKDERGYDGNLQLLREYSLKEERGRGAMNQEEYSFRHQD